MNFDINIIRAEIEDWAVEQGQEHVAIEISRAYLRLVINQNMVDYMPLRIKRG